MVYDLCRPVVGLDDSCGSVPTLDIPQFHVTASASTQYSSTGFLTSGGLSAHTVCGMRGEPNEDKNYVRCKIMLKICKPSRTGASLTPQEPALSTGTPG